MIEIPNTYQCATLRLRQNVDLAEIFLAQGGSFSLISKHLREKKSCYDSGGRES